MFYSHSILAKSGPFAHVWLAATWEKKVTRSMIFGTDIATVVESIANPAAPLALRLSANLLVGVVRIYARKARAGVFAPEGSRDEASTKLAAMYAQLNTRLAAALEDHDWKGRLEADVLMGEVEGGAAGKYARAAAAS